MHWSTLILLTAGLAAPQAVVETLQFDSYTQAYRAAGAVHKPMLVILNPSPGQVSTAETITREQLLADERIAPLLDHYVVAVVDTGTDVGQEVHRRFGTPALPFVAVIDENQKKQVYRSTTTPTLDTVATIVAKYKTGAATSNLQAGAFGDCPNCRRNWSNF
jgi:hypothetical protein